MSTAAGEGILSWLDTAITKAEQDAVRWHDVECDVHGTSLIDAIVLESATLCGCGGPESVLRRCAADRKLLTLHEPRPFLGGGMPDPAECSECHNQAFPCPTIVALAEGYGWTGGDR